MDARVCACPRSRVCFRTYARTCVFRALSLSFAPQVEQPTEDRAARPGSTSGYGRAQHRRTWLGGVGFGALGGGVMSEERLRLLLRGGDSGRACSKRERISGMPLGALF